MLSPSLQVALLALMQLAPTESTPLESPPAKSVLTQPPVPSFTEPTPAPPRTLPQSAAPATPIEAARTGTSVLQPANPNGKPANPNGIVVPARAEVAISSLSSSQENISPISLLRQATTQPTQNEIAGRALTLGEALQRSNDRQQQLAVVNQYWRLAIELADYYWAVEELELLKQIAIPQLPFERRLLTAAQAAAKARRSEAKLAVVAAQFDLIAVAQLPKSEILPLSSDIPLVTPYRTNFANIFQNQTAPIALQRIDKSLPQLLELLKERANAVASAELALQSLLDALRNSEVHLALVLDWHNRLRNQRISFLTTVRDYNLTIANYALSVVGPNVSQAEIVAMLVASAPRAKSVLVPGRNVVTPAVAEETITNTAETEAVPPAASSNDAAPGKLVPVEPAKPEVKPDR